MAADSMTGTSKLSSSPGRLLLAILSFFLLSDGGSAAAAAAEETGGLDQSNAYLKIGAIVNGDSRAGKEAKIAMGLAVENYNSVHRSNNLKMLLHFKSPGNGGGDLQAAYAAEELIRDDQVQAIIGTETWPQAALVAEVGNRFQVPVLSLAPAATTPPSLPIRRPFFIGMAANSTEQVRCIAELVHSFHWRKVIAIYEDDINGGDSGMVALLSEALQNVGSEIEYRLVFPPFSSVSSDPEQLVREALDRLSNRQSRIFVVLRSSLLLASYLFREAEKMGLSEKQSAWIITDAIGDLLDSVNSSVIPHMQGTLGIKTYYSEESKSFRDFSRQFRRSFREEFPEEDNSYPGIHALRAYDGISALKLAIMEGRSTNSSIIASGVLLEKILSLNFMGLSGKIHFKGGERSASPIFRVINVIGKRYRELDFWLPGFGFSKDLVAGEGMGMLDGSVVYWPGELKCVPKGWAMPTETKPLVIGVPGRTSFEKFVKVEWAKEIPDEGSYSGFCIELFRDVVSVLKENYTIHYRFKPFNGSYDDLVEHVHNKSYDAVIGDVTILANRAKHLEFTQPFAESGLTMIVPLKSQGKAWIFMKPFTEEMWVVTACILIYTMFVVWFLEHRSNPEFRGPWKSQLGTALWFTFSTLFFAHREKIRSNFTRMVIVVWLFVVLVLTSSYTASLTSMLTVPRLEPKPTDIELLRTTNSVVGCDGDSFVRKYLVDVLKFLPGNIKNVSSEYGYPGEFVSGNITAAFLELPYQKVFLKRYCKDYTVTGPIYRFGGLGFAFQKGSPLAADVSQAILILSENGRLKDLEEKWFSPSSECSKSQDAAGSSTDNLGLQSFWGLFLISFATSTICFIAFLVQLFKNYRRHRETASEGNVTPTDNNSVWDKTIRLAQYFHNGDIDRTPGRASISPQTHEIEECEWTSPAWDQASSPPTPEHPHMSSPGGIEIETQ